VIAGQRLSTFGTPARISIAETTVVPDPLSGTAAKDAAVPWLDPDNVSTF